MELTASSAGVKSEADHEKEKLILVVKLIAPLISFFYFVLFLSI